MQEYYFLFALALVWTIFATVQDLRSREVANWLNFSLIIFSLAYRAFYSIAKKDPWFFLLGLSGFILFFLLSYLFYYLKAFAGGDAKLLMGLSVILPYQSLSQVPYLAFLFIFLLFLVGSLYSIIYSIPLAIKNKKVFSKEAKKLIKNTKLSFWTSLSVFILAIILSPLNPITLPAIPLALIYPLVIYVKSLDKCLIKLKSPNQLTEGDWLEREVKIGKTKISKSVHGLSKKDIAFLKRHNKKVYIKEGIPFVPAFLITLIITELFFLISTAPFSLLSSFLP